MIPKRSESPSTTSHSIKSSISSSEPKFPHQLIKDLKSIHGKKGVYDVKLKGTDGQVVPAVKAILSARSEVFRKMFFNEHKSKRTATTTLHIKFETKIILALVEYCFTDDVEALDKEVNEAYFREVLNLLKAAQHFRLDDLVAKLYSWLVRMIQANAALTCTAFSEIHSICWSDERLNNYLWHVLRFRTMDALLPSKDAIGNGITTLPYPILCDFVKDTHLNVDEYTIFLCLKRWVEGFDLRNTDSNSKSKKWKKRNTSDINREDVTALTRYIEFSRIRPKYISNQVAFSGFVEVKFILPATIVQSLILERDGISSDFRRCSKLPRAIYKGGLSVDVCEAGTVAVNGTYFFSGFHQDFPIFSKQGIWKDREVSFILRREIVGNVTNGKQYLWTIGQLSPRQIFYKSKIIPRIEMHLIPKLDWIAADAKANAPPPIVRETSVEYF